MRLKKEHTGILQKFKNMRLAHKLMLVYSAILGVTIIVFAGQLINVANNSTELNLVNDTQKLLKETTYSIEREMDTCYRAINSLSIDYNIMSYLKNWDERDKTNIFDFKLDLTYKAEQIVNLSSDIYQFRIYISNPNFPEIGSIIYSDSRLTNNKTIHEESSNSPNGYWLLDHKEENYNTSTLERKNVVSLFRTILYSNNKELGIAEVTIPTKIFFRHLFSQPENENMISFVVDNKQKVITDVNSAFAKKYKFDKSEIVRLYIDHNLKGESGNIHLSKDGIPMNLIYDYIEKLDCSVCYVVTNESIRTNLKNKRNLIIVESLVAMVILCVLIYFFTNILLIKMKQIIASMRKVESGKFDIRVDISGQDEMSELAYHFNKMLGKIGDLISEVVKKQEAKKNAEIHALFSQINSHFIINTLQNISMMAEIECKFEVADSITSLGKLLRYSMKWSKEFVTLSEEIEYIKNYVILMNIRYNFEIKLDIQIPKGFLQYKVLKMMLQPAVENSIYYGIEPQATGGTITVVGYSEDEFTIIEIIDDGVGMDEERLENVQQGLLLNLPLEHKKEERGNGIGLSNVNERIKLFYGDNYGIEILSIKDSFTKVIIKLPENSKK
jgi:two-component system, sensor histidine kinase YesM